MSVVRKLGMRTGKSQGAKDLVIECQVCKPSSPPRQNSLRLFGRDLAWVPIRRNGLMNSTGPPGARARKTGLINKRNRERNSRFHLSRLSFPLGPLCRRVLRESRFATKLASDSFSDPVNGSRAAGQYFVEESNGKQRISPAVSSMILKAKPGLSSCIQRQLYLPTILSFMTLMSI